MIGIDVFVRNMGLLGEYKIGDSHDYVSYFSNYCKMSRIEIDKILKVNCSFVVNNLTNATCSYNYLCLSMKYSKVDYVEVYLHKLEDDYYYVDIYLSIGDNSRWLGKIQEGYSYYKLDQIGGLLKFLKILFRYE